MNLRYYIDPETGLPHMYRHGVIETEVEEILSNPIESRRGEEDSTMLLGRTWGGRYLRVIVSIDPDRQGCFVITAYDLRGNALRALRRRQKRRGR